jgi:uncharacterized integral membrane protein
MKQKTLSKPSEGILLNELELLLSEKRTYYSILRTGFAVLTVALSMMVFLVATRDYVKTFTHKWTAAAVIIILFAFVVAGIVMCLAGMRKIKKIDKAIQNIQKEDKRVEKIVI